MAAASLVPPGPPSSLVGYESRLKSAESALTFVREEHRKVLDGLHEEIRRLQQKCADLQFSLTSTQASAKAEEELRSQVQDLQQEAAERRDRESMLEEKLRDRSAKAEELEQQLRWTELEHKNQLASKDAKIDQLQHQVTASAEAGRLQGEVKRLYLESGAEARARMEEVVRRAKTPARSAGGGEESLSSSQNFQHQQHGRPPPPPVMMMRAMPSPASTRSKVFRHKLQKAQQQQHPSDGDGAVGRTTPLSVSRHEAVARRHSSSSSSNNEAVLPVDYRARVSTLPPILARSNSITGGVGGPVSAVRMVDTARTVSSAAAAAMIKDGREGLDLDRSLEVAVLADTERRSKRKESGATADRKFMGSSPSSSAA